MTFFSECSLLARQVRRRVGNDETELARSLVDGTGTSKKLHSPKRSRSPKDNMKVDYYEQVDRTKHKTVFAESLCFEK